MVTHTSKKSKVSHHIDPHLLLSIDKLQELQDELKKEEVASSALKRKDKFFEIWKKLVSSQVNSHVNEDANDKVLQIEQKYNEIRRPVYARRGEIIKRIPDFWSTVFQSHPTLGENLLEEDQKVFKYLDSIEVEESKDMKLGYSITFSFKPNPYFEDTKLTKSFTFLDEGTTKITGTAIKWKDGMDTTNGNTNEKKGNKRLPVDDSFFSWFSETQHNDTAEDLHDEVAELIKEELWINPLKYFNNEADEEYSDGDEDEEVDEDEDDD